jgi:predicted RNA-binding protein with PUA-like domain
MAFWLMKTEPSEFSYGDLERKGRAVWDGVTNSTALIHIRAMRKGDRALVYHSGGEKKLVGLADIVSDPYPDPNAGDVKIVVVDVAPAGRLSRIVPLGAIKKEREFASFELVRNSRLSVMPVQPALWKKLLAMAN